MAKKWLPVINPSRTVFSSHFSRWRQLGSSQRQLELISNSSCAVCCAKSRVDYVSLCNLSACTLALLESGAAGGGGVWASSSGAVNEAAWRISCLELISSLDNDVNVATSSPSSLRRLFVRPSVRLLSRWNVSELLLVDDFADRAGFCRRPVDEHSSLWVRRNQVVEHPRRSYHLLTLTHPVRLPLTGFLEPTHANLSQVCCWRSVDSCENLATFFRRYFSGDSSTADSMMDCGPIFSLKCSMAIAHLSAYVRLLGCKEGSVGFPTS